MLYIFLVILFFVGFSWIYIEFLPILNNWFYVLWTFSGLVSSLLLFVLYSLFIVFVLYKILPINSKLKHHIMWQYSDLILLMGRIKVEVKGEENIPHEPFVVYANHKSMLDPVILYNVYKKRISAVAKSTLAKVKVLKVLMDEMGVVLIDRGNDREATKSIIKGIKNIKDYNIGYIIFPEGGIKTRETEVMVDVKPGAYKLATKAEAAISPASIIGSSKISKRGHFTISRIKVIIHKPLYKEDYNDLNTTELGDKIFDIVNDGVNNG